MDAKLISGLVLLPVASQAFRRALSISLLLFVMLVADKVLKLPTGLPAGLFEGTPVSNAWDFVVARTQFAYLPKLLVCSLLVGALVYMITRWRHRVPLAIVAAVPLVYAGSVAAGAISGDTNPWASELLGQSFLELEQLLALYWQDLGVALVVLALLSWLLAVEARNHSKLARAATILVIAVPLVLTGLDISYFVATRTQLTSSELFYAVASPFDAVTATKDAFSWNNWAGVFLALAVLGVCLFIALRRQAPASTQSRAPLGFVAWPTVALLFAAPVVPLNLRLEQFADSPVARFSSDALIEPVIQLVTLQGNARGSERVPVLDSAAVKATSTSNAAPLNVVIIMLESARADATTIYSPDLDTTPFLAELARESLVVDNMYAVVPRTSAAWIATLTGRYPAPVTVIKRWSEGRNAHVLNSSLARLLRPLGYTSAYFMPTELNFENENGIVQALGFDKVVSAETLHADPAERLNSYGWEDRVLLKPIDQWLAARQADAKPFLLTIMTNVGHYPYTLPKGAPQREFLKRGPDENLYLSSMSYIDTYLRDVVGSLREHGFLENTVLVVLGDHGEAFREHGGYSHTLVIYDEALHVPMLMRLPAEFGRRGRVGGLRQQIDVVPTITEALGLKLSGGSLAGRSFLSDPAGHQTLFFSTHLDGTYLAMRDGNMKYVYNFGRRPLKVFDLLHDRGEHENLHDTVSMHARLQAQADMLAWRARVSESYQEGLSP